MYVDKQFDVETEYDIEYGVSTDFAGNERTLKVNLIQPIGDSVPECGRPLLLLIHGGAFLAGSKDDAGIQRLGEDFAKRGYAVATLNYRLGQFQTNQTIHCNASNLGLQWDCLNMTDSSEWYRAWYRGVQDAKGAIRYLLSQAQYNLDNSNVFTIGESAGGFVALGLGYLDEANEVLPGLTSAMPDVLPPNPIYESPCIQHPDFMLDTSIASMDLSRPDLGGIDGELNPAQPGNYLIRAVGNLYGAVFNDIFGSSQPLIPGLFTYHQPADLIVPIGHQRLFAGYNYCATQFPFNCANIINRPMLTVRMNG
ncbi:MAG: alpha/beta hydrolase [Saprospiraceae bacterium]